MRFTLAQNSWSGGEPVQIELPDDWEISRCGIKADEMRPLSRAEIVSAIAAPIASPKLSEIAVGKKEAAIVFDDMSRGTPCRDIAEIIIETLLAAGIDKRHIRFICATGSHGTCDMTFFEKKLGRKIISEYAIFNHNAFQNTSYAGTTSGGVELYINSELMACDLKIGIGSITPHPVNGFGGGAKIAAIGCAGIKTISQLHEACQRGMAEKKLSFFECVGNLEHDGMRREIDEAAKLIGLDFKVDAILNSNCEIVALTAGDPVEEYYKGVEYAVKYNFCEKLPQGQDVVIVNANVKANEAGLAIAISKELLKPGGTLVLVDFNRSGQVTHQYSGPAGYFIGGPAYRGRSKFEGIGQVIMYNPYTDLASLVNLGEPDRITPARTWDQVMRILSEYGEGTKAAVIADGTITAYPIGQRTVR